MTHELPLAAQQAFRRIALSAIDPQLDGSRVAAALRQATAFDPRRFGDFLVWHKLAPLWSHLIEQSRDAANVDAALRERLKTARRESAARCLLETHTLRDVSAALDGAAIAHIVFKGAHLRQIAYPDPALRPMADIDILVAPRDRARAETALRNAGFAADDAQRSTHERTWSRAGVDVDLHWDVLRPGRTRMGLADAILDRRVRDDGLWAPCDEDAMVLMLLHPAFAKYVNSRHAGLVTIVDFMRWTAARPVDWDVVAARLDAAGVRTAAWAVATWFRDLAPQDESFVPRRCLDILAPGLARQAYVRTWLQHDLSTRWLRAPIVIQAGLTLALHDRFSDAARATLQRALPRRPAQTADN